MKLAVCYYSRHHRNTLKVLEAMAQEREMDLIDVTARSAVGLGEYDVVGFASGIYYGKFHKTVTDFLGQYLPQGKDVFFVYTCGSKGKGYTQTIAQAAGEKRARILGEYGCRGFDTFGPFKLVGGTSKGHPDETDLENARRFFAGLCE